MNVYNESGKGYWMEGFGCIRAEGGNRPSRPGHVVCAAFMGGQGAKARSIAYCDDGTTPTLKSVLSGGNTVPDVVILNDQGGDVMNVSEGITSTLRAEDHGHPPVICFEPGIAKREGSDSRFVDDKSVTLRAQMGDNQPAVCYKENHD